MKLGLIVGVMLAVLGVARGAEQPAAPGPVFDVPRLKEIAIDGKLDDWGVAGFRVEILTSENGETKPPAEFDPSFRLGWDEGGLLVAVQVKAPDFREADKDDQLYDGDGVEMYLATAVGAADLFQAVVAPGMDPKHSALRLWMNDLRKNAELKKSPINITAARTPVAGGYLLEARLPWAALGITPRAGVEVGFQLYAARRGADNKLFHAVWYPRTATSSNSRAMHRIRLGDQASGAVRAVAALRYEQYGMATVTAVGAPSLVGREAVVETAAGKMPAGTFSAAAPRPTLNVPLPLPAFGSGLAAPQVLVDGVPVATVAAPLLVLPRPAPDELLFGSRIQRTMTLLATSTAKERHPVKIMVYGQSIMGNWVGMLEAELRWRYPAADLTMTNLAIGGFTAEKLVRSAEHDLYPFYPDLMILHAYGGEYAGEMERVIAETRRRTTAEIMIFTHHAPMNDVPTDQSAQHLRWLAQQYGCELVDVHREWREYLADTGLPSSLLLGDRVHPSEAGHALIALLLGRHCRLNLNAPSDWTDRVRRFDLRRAVEEGATDEVGFTGAPWGLAAAPYENFHERSGIIGTNPASALKLVFRGNRVDLIAAVYRGQTGTARILIDGQSPSRDPRLYTITRPSLIPGQTIWPALKRVGHRVPLVLEDWTLRIREISEDNKQLSFDVTGSMTGPDGRGTGAELFVSKSGRVVIEPQDWMCADVAYWFGVKTKPGAEVKWKVNPQFVDVLRLPAAPDPKDENAWEAYCAAGRAMTIAQGLTNGDHVLEIVPNGDGPVPLESIRIYRPPLR